MTTTKKIQTMVAAGLLCAVGIVIPMFFPKITIPPMSFTLASHVPVFLAAFISPVVAAVVSLGTTLGFVLSGLPLIVALRALTHVVWAVIGAVMLQKRHDIMKSVKGFFGFGLLLSVIHAIGEVIVVTFFYFGGFAAASYYEAGFLNAVVLLVGVGTIAHSMVDYAISVAVWKPVRKMLSLPANADI